MLKASGRCDYYPLNPEYRKRRKSSEFITIITPFTRVEISCATVAQRCVFIVLFGYTSPPSKSNDIPIGSRATLNRSKAKFVKLDIISRLFIVYFFRWHSTSTAGRHPRRRQFVGHHRDTNFSTKFIKINPMFVFVL